MSRPSGRLPAVVALAVTALLSLAPAAARAQAAGCVDLCGASCVKPWAIPDRWDDVTGIPGYMGGAKTRPDWRNNARWDCESFTDLNGDRLHDAGEPYVDGNGNGLYDAELYDSALTGYVAAPMPGNLFSPGGDVGRQLVLHSSLSTTPAPGQYYAIDLPPVNKGTPIIGSDEYRSNMATCNPVVVEAGDLLQLDPGAMSGPTNQAMRDLIAQDPNAAWDDATSSVINSDFALSPRTVVIPVHDPRLPITSVAYSVRVTKVVAFFMERMPGAAECSGRLLRTIAPGVAGPPCAAGQVGGFLVDCPVPATPATWGRMKAAYR